MRQLAGYRRRLLRRAMEPAPAANRALVIGNTFDPSTPYQGSIAMANELARARLLTVDG